MEERVAQLKAAQGAKHRNAAARATEKQSLRPHQASQQVKSDMVPNDMDAYYVDPLFSVVNQSSFVGSGYGASVKEQKHRMDKLKEEMPVRFDGHGMPMKAHKFVQEHQNVMDESESDEEMSESEEEEMPKPKRMPKKGKKLLPGAKKPLEGGNIFDDIAKGWNDAGDKVRGALGIGKGKGKKAPGNKPLMMDEAKGKGMKKDKMPPVAEIAIPKKERINMPKIDSALRPSPAEPKVPLDRERVVKPIVNMPKVSGSGTRSARGCAVAKLMKEKGMKLGEASKYLKEHPELLK